MARKILGGCVIVIVMAVALCMQSCTSSDFKVSAELKGLGSQNVRVAYRGADGGIVDSWITAQNDALVITGKCSEPTLLMVYNSMSVPVMRLLISGGDKLEVKGSISSPYELEIKGSDIMEEWNKFVVKHKNEYDMNNAPKLNEAIEKYVKDNPKSLVSTLLVLLDYAPSDDNKVAQLLKEIDDSAKPESIMESFNTITLRLKNPNTSLTSLNLLEMESDDFKVAKLAGTKPSVILFWDKDLENNKRSSAFEELKMLDTTRVNIIDINIDSDSTQWRNTVAATASKWKHYWAPGSMMNSELLRLQIKTTPTIIVTDSLGHQQYRGDDPIKARQTAESF
jgi:hypothetical protein